MSFTDKIKNIFKKKKSTNTENIDGIQFVPIEYEGKTLLVSSDYYMIDGIRTPMGMRKAKEVLTKYNAFFPTPSIVDAIWKNADLKLKPKFMKPGPNMTSKEYYVDHNTAIENQIAGREFKLVAGHKKDIVIPLKNDKVTIYGWHYSTGRPVQPVSSVHGAEYYDYSHGLRLVKWA
jgi:hypothetical protein